MCLGAREPRSKRDPNTPARDLGGASLCTSFVQMHLRLFRIPGGSQIPMCGRGSAEVPRKRPGEPVSCGCSKPQPSSPAWVRRALPNLNQLRAAVHKTQHTFQPL